MIAVLVVGIFLTSLSPVYGVDVYTTSGQVYRATQYKIFDNTLVVSLKDGRQQKLLLREIDWGKTIGDKDVFQLVETGFVYTRDGKAIRSKVYMIRPDERVEIITPDNKILMYDKSDIDFVKVATSLIKEKIKINELDGSDSTTTPDNISALLAETGEVIYCNNGITLSSKGIPVVKFKFDLANILRDAKFGNLFLTYVIIQASAKNLSNTTLNLSYDDFILVTNEGVQVKPDSSKENTFFIQDLATNSMTFGTMRFFFTSSASSGAVEYLVYRGVYGRFKCRLP